MEATVGTYREFDTHAAFHPEWRLAGSVEFLAFAFVALAIILIDVIGRRLRDGKGASPWIPGPSIPVASFIILLTALLDRAVALAAYSGASALGP